MKLPVLTPIIKLSFFCLAIPGWLTYTNTANKFTINYPKEWVHKDVSNTIAFLSPRDGESDTFQENVNLMLQDLSQQPMNLEQYTALSKKQIIENSGASAILSQGTKILAGQKAVEMVYNMNYQGRPLKIKQYWFIKNKTAFLFTYTAEPAKYARYEETATSVINSFTFY
jgi:hypothetical protein